MPTMPLNQLAFLSECLVLRSLKRARTSASSERTLFPSCPSTAVAWTSPGNAHFIAKRRLAGALLYCQLSPAATARRPASFVLQLRNGLGTVPRNDSASLQQHAPRSPGCCCFRCRLNSLLLQHPKRARCPLCWFASRRRL